MTDRNIVVITAGIGTPSSSRMLADTLARDTKSKLSMAGLNSTVRTFELKDYAVEIANNMTGGYAQPKLAEVIKAVEESHMLIAVTPVFTASMSGLFKSFFDILDNKVLTNKPVILGATGGTTRHSMVIDYAMRPMFNYLRANIMPTAVYASPEDWGAGDLEKRIARAAQYAVEAVKDKAPEQWEEPAGPSFEDMLASLGG